jgi:hypothetical protein
VCIMATVVCDAADPTTEAELTRTRRARGQGVMLASVPEPVTDSHRAEQPGHAPEEKLDTSRPGTNVLTAATAISLTGPSRHTDLGRPRYLSRGSVQPVTSWPRRRAPINLPPPNP